MLDIQIFLAILGCVWLTAYLWDTSYQYFLRFYESNPEYDRIRKEGMRRMRQAGLFEKVWNCSLAPLHEEFMFRFLLVGAAMQSASTGTICFVLFAQALLFGLLHTNYLLKDRVFVIGVRGLFYGFAFWSCSIVWNELVGLLASTLLHVADNTLATIMVSRKHALN